MRAARWRTGVTVGTFNPPHLGHAHLVRTGAAKVGHLHVLLGDRPDQTLRATDRARWLADTSPENVTIHVTPDDLPEANELWAERALQVLPDPPDVAFTSEGWGPGWASAMRAVHVAVDPGRVAVPVRAADLRRDLRAGFTHLVPAARAALASRVVVVGAQSTGKSTLAQALARTLRTVWVPEHGRSYTEGRRHLVDPAWGAEEFRRIADAQQQLVADLSRLAASALVVVDTDALTTAVWHHRCLGGDDAALDRMVAVDLPHHYLVCAPDFEWVQDGSRESREQRLSMHEDTLRRVTETGVDHTVLGGPHLDRMVQALAVIDTLTARPVLV